ncbi:MAG: DUF5671 domain-containing protein [Minisyncoccia bacterium]
MEQDNLNLSASKRNIPRDLFLHFFVIITLYWSTISFITLIWQYINYFFPDVLNNYSNYYAFPKEVKFALSSLIIIFPLFMILSFYLNKIYNNEPEVKDSKIRKWLVYFTLFVAGIIMTGDLVSIVNNFLNGEITTRFILKALTIFLVSGIIFWYYLNDIRNKISSKNNKYIAIILSAIILISIIFAFIVFGSPQTARLIKFDEQKISDLQNIQYQIFTYWEQKGNLPQSLNDLKDLNFGYSLPKDPQTKSDYKYNIKDKENLVFELCAVFNKPAPKFLKEPYSAPIKPQIFNNDNWNYESGEFCFERKINKELYAPKIKN